MTRDKDCGATPDLVDFWQGDPGEHNLGTYGTYGADSAKNILCVAASRFKSLTGLPLPRAGSERKVDMKILIKDAKGGP